MTEWVFNTHELAWCAGFWDGEGCTSRMKQYRPYGTYLFPNLIISQTDRRVLDRFQAAVGFGSVSPRPGHGATKPYHVWRAGGFKSLILLSNLIGPYLSTIKIEQMQRVMDDCVAFKKKREAHGRPPETVL